MDTLLFVLREIDGRSGEGRVTARRTLSSVVKITSKKKHPDLITFKFGETLPDGDITINDIDRSVSFLKFIVKIFEIRILSLF